MGCISGLSIASLVKVLSETAHRTFALLLSESTAPQVVREPQNHQSAVIRKKASLSTQNYDFNVESPPDFPPQRSRPGIPPRPRLPRCRGVSLGSHLWKLLGLFMTVVTVATWEVAAVLGSVCQCGSDWCLLTVWLTCAFGGRTPQRGEPF